MGVRYKAIIKHHNRILKTKTFKTKAAARTWAKRIEADNEQLEAYGLLGNTMTFTELADEYMRQWTGKDKMRAARVQWWCDHIGQCKLINVTSQLIRDHLNDYLAGDAQRYAGIDEHMRVKTVSTGRKRSNASYNRHRSLYPPCSNMPSNRLTPLPIPCAMYRPRRKARDAFDILPMRNEMGGFGSGTWLRWNTKDTVQSTKALDIRELNRNITLCDGNTGIYQWTLGGQVIGSVRFNVEHSRLVLSYQWGQAGEAVELIEEPIAFDWTSCHYGG